MTDYADEIWLQRLEELRRSANISIDAQGHWWHDQVCFEHPRIISALNTGLGWKSDAQLPQNMSPQSCFESWEGEATVHLGTQWCYVDCDLTPFLVMKLQPDYERQSLIAILNNRERWPLRLLGLSDDVLFTRLTNHRLARFSVDAQAQCAEWLTQDPDNTFALVWGDQRWVIQDSLSTST